MSFSHTDRSKKVASNSNSKFEEMEDINEYQKDSRIKGQKKHTNKKHNEHKMSRNEYRYQ